MGSMSSSIKKKVVASAIAVSMLGLGFTIVNDNPFSANAGDGITQLTHKDGHQYPPGCSKGQGGYKNKAKKKCKKHPAP